MNTSGRCLRTEVPLITSARTPAQCSTEHAGLLLQRYRDQRAARNQFLPHHAPRPADRHRVSAPRCRVYVLVRAKQGRPPAQRLQRLLDGGLFHLLWDRPGVLEKVPPGLYLHC
jgi:hypothetical protein